MRANLNKKEKQQLFSYFEDRFGVTKDKFKGISFFKTSSKYYMITEECISHPLFSLTETAGLAILRPDGAFKPTTDFLQLFGKFITKNYIELSKEETECFLRGENIDKEFDVEEGYVLVKYSSHMLGCGNYKQCILKNLVPKSRRIRIKELY